MRFGLLGIGSDLEVTDKTTATVIIKDELNELVRGTTADGVRDVCFSGYGIGAV